MMRRIMVLTVVLFLLALAGSACKTKPKQKEQAKAGQPKTPSVEILVLSVSDQIPEITTGWTLSINGHLIAWRRNTGNALFDEQNFEVPSQEVMAIIAELKKTGILQKKLNESGKPTYHLTYKSGEQVVHLSWSNSTKLPPEFSDWYQKTIEWCRQQARK
jgi:hypothetical protein